MLSIIWMILKIIGILILLLLGLLVGAVLLILLVPVRYRMSGSYYGELKGTARISWLLHICSVSVIYDGGPDVTVRIFGIPVGKGKKKKKASEPDFDDGIETEYPDAEPEMLSIQELKPEEETEKKPLLEKPLLGDERARSTGAVSVTRKKRAISDRSGIFKRFIEKLKFSFKRFCDKLKHIRENMENIKAWVNDEKNREVVALLWKQGKKLFRHVLPRKAKGKVSFGFEDPYTTGQVLSYVSLVYPLCHKQLTVCPVFDRTVFEGEIWVKGRVRIGAIARSVVVLLMNKHFRVLLKRYLR